MYICILFSFFFFTSLFHLFIQSVRSMCFFVWTFLLLFYFSFPVCRLSASLSPSGSFCAKKKWSKHLYLRFDSLLEKKSVAIKNNRTVDLKSAHLRHIHTVKGKKRERGKMDANMPCVFPTNCCVCVFFFLLFLFERSYLEQKKKGGVVGDR